MSVACMAESIRRYGLMLSSACLHACLRLVYTVSSVSEVAAIPRVRAKKIYVSYRMLVLRRTRYIPSLRTCSHSHRLRC